MIVIVCLDDRQGMMFASRRQSRDRAVTEDILRLTEGQKLWINQYSAGLFQNKPGIVVCEDFLQKAGDGEYCFVENIDLMPYKEKIEKIICYMWNRVYPADMRFDISLLNGFKWLENTDFRGNSHDKIDRISYVREV